MKARARIAHPYWTTFAALILSILPAISGAHHSRAEFSDDVLVIEGEIVEVGWRNPHPVITVKSADDAGLEKLWKVESWQSANSLDRKGVPDGNLLRVGDRIAAAGRESMRRPGLFLGTNVRLANGSEIILRTQENPISADRSSAESSGQSTATSSRRQKSHRESFASGAMRAATSCPTNSP